jgi:hypothetical protein
MGSGKVVQVNFDYEYQLSHEGQRPLWAAKVNREMEYIALLWGEIEALHNLQQYSQEYLASLSKLSFKLPKLDMGSPNSWFWGRLEDLANEWIWNSKRTSFEFSQKMGWSLPDEKLYLAGERIELNKKEVFKPIDSTSGRGFSFGPHEAFIAPMDGIKGQWLDRFIDLSFFWSKDYQFALLNLNDSKGAFRGAIVLEEDILWTYLETLTALPRREIVEKIAATLAHYRKLGAPSVQIDCFFYRDENNQPQFYPLCEVNVRKTMGELTFRLWKSLYSGAHGMKLTFGPRASGVILSPPGSKRALGVQKLMIKSQEDVAALIKS